MLYDRGTSLLDLPLRDRRKRLDSLALPDPVRVSEALDAGAADLVHAAKEQGLEGIVAKRLNSHLRARRSQRSVGEIQGESRAGAGHRRVHAGAAGVRVAAGRILRRGRQADVHGEDQERLRAAHAEGGGRARSRSSRRASVPFANLPEPKNARRGEALTAEVMKKCRWLRPELVAQVEYTDWTAANHLRHSRFAGLRDDKPAREVVRESAA